MDPKATAVSTPANPGTFNARCTELWDSTATLQNLISPTTMDGAKIFDGSAFVDFDPTLHGAHISLFSYARYSSVLWAVAAATQEFQGVSASPAQVEVAAPYTGPVLQAPGALSPVTPGAKVVFEGSNLSGVSNVSIGGKDALVQVNSARQLELTVPVDLAPGTWDLVITSDSGVLTVQGAITVSESLVDSSSGVATPSTKRMQDGTAKVWVFDVVGAGKVQIFVNGKEIAWVNATDANDSKLFNGYLVRTVELAEGKNVIEVFVDGERERRTVYSN
jgi:hypothetical protein